AKYELRRMFLPKRSVYPALAEESVRDFEVLVSRVPKAHQAMWAFSGSPTAPMHCPPIGVATTSSERGTMRAIQRHAAAQTWTPGLRWGRGHTNSRLSQAEGNHLPRERVCSRRVSARAACASLQGRAVRDHSANHLGLAAIGP